MLTIQTGMPARVRPNTPGFAESAGILSLARYWDGYASLTENGEAIYDELAAGQWEAL